MSVGQKPIKTFEIDTGVSPDFLEAALTQDVTTLEALFDLVDNSIDAARDVLLQNNTSKCRDGLPESYKGFKIHIRIDKNSVRIVDNCSGIDEVTLANRALYTAKPSSHEYGIGQYGIGLKRSLLKMGTDFALSVDNGKTLCKANFSNKNIGGNLDNKVYASEYNSKNRVKSLFSASNLKPEISIDIHDTRWFDNAARQFSLRYGIYLIKGLEIILHNVANCQFLRVEGIAPELRTHSKFEPQRKRVSIDGVEVIIESGIHSDYIFPSETGHDLSKNRSLTDFFGIYFSCNDRVIVSATTEKIYGWAAKWHSEYNGFVCWVKFVSKDPSKLPWNTSKTALRTDSSLFLKVKDELQPIADHYRSEIKKRYSNKGNDPISNPDPKPKPSKPKGKPTSEPKPKKPKKRPHVNLSRDRDIFIDWNKCETIVPESRQKEHHIFVEMCRLSSEQIPIVCVVMLRVFLETTVKEASKSMSLSWQTLSKSSLSVSENLHSAGYITDPVKELIKQYANTNAGLFSINNIQSHIHSTRFHPNQSKANTYWDELDPFLAGCWRFIQDSDES